jgi:Zn-dependent membrane protease YugP
MPMFVFGLIADVMWLTHLGEYLFIGLVLYHVFMLPLEMDGRKKTMRTMTRRKMLAPDELDDVSEVYQAATLTQLSIALTSIGHLIKLIVLSHKE